MKNGLIWSIVIAMSLGTTSLLAQDKAAATALFSKHSCTGCHSIKAHGIEKKASASDAKDADEEKDDGDKKEAPDLSKAGKERDATWIGKYMMKKEKIKGKAHKKKFKGTPEEKEVLATWLASLK